MLKKCKIYYIATNFSLVWSTTIFCYWAVYSLVFGVYSLPVLHSAEFLIPTHRYHLQALRHLYVLAAEPRLLTPVDVDSNTPCYALIEVTYKVMCLQGKKEKRPLRRCGRQLKTLIYQRHAIFIVVASSLGFVFNLWWRRAKFYRNNWRVVLSPLTPYTCFDVTLRAEYGTSKRHHKVFSQVCNDWPSVIVLLLKRKDFQRHRGGWNHLWF